MYHVKKLFYWLLAKIDCIWELFSERLCFFCQSQKGGLVCKSCLRNSFDFKTKLVDYKILDNFFNKDEQVYPPSIFFLFNFQKETSHLIKKAKYSRPHYAQELAKKLSEYFLTYQEEIFYELCLKKQEVNLFITEVPMYQKKYHQRAFNFAYELAKEFYENLVKQDFKKVFFIPGLFERLKNTKALYDLDPTKRMEELRDAFAMQKLEGFSKTPSSLNLLLIIDDISTTGSTLMELMKLSRQAAYFDEDFAMTLYGRNLKFS